MSGESESISVESIDKNEDNQMKHSKISHPTRKTFGDNFRTSLHNVSSFYEANNKILSSRFAGIDENEEEIFEENKDDIEKKGVDSSNLMSQSKREYKEQTEKGELSFAAALFIYIKVNVVSGFLFLPNGFKNGGWLFSLSALIFSSIVIVYSNIALTSSTDRANTYSFSRIGFKAMGKKGKYIVDYLIAISQISFPCGFANIIITVTNNIVKIWLKSEDDYYWYIAGGLALIVIPLCQLRNINKLAAMHFLGDLAVLATCVVLGYESITIINGDPNFNFDNVKLINNGWYKLLGMAMSSLEGIGVILPIKEAMKDKTKFNSVVYIGNVIISIILIGFPLIGYFCFQDDTQEIILNNLSLDKIYIQVILFFLIFSIIVVTPVTYYPAFKILETNFFQKCGKFTPIAETFLRLFLSAACIVIGAASINKFDVLLALSGSVICTPIAIIFPPLFHYCIHKDVQPKWRNFTDLLLFIVGIALSITILVFTLINL